MLACWQQDRDSSPAMPQYSNFRAGTGRVEPPWPRCPLYRVVPATVGVAPPIPATVRVRGGRASDRIAIPAALLGSGSTGGDGEEFEAAGAVGRDLTLAVSDHVPTSAVACVETVSCGCAH